MTVGLLVTEIVCAFILAACILYRYGNWYRHHIFVTLSVLLAWYFSFLIIFVLPLDVSSVSTFKYVSLIPKMTGTFFLNCSPLLCCGLFNDTNCVKMFRFNFFFLERVSQANGAISGE